MMAGSMVSFWSPTLSDPQTHPSYQPTPASGFNEAQLAASGSVLHMAVCPDGACPWGQSLALSIADHWADGPGKTRQKNLSSAEHDGGGPHRVTGSGRQAGRAINLQIYAWRSPLMFHKEAKFNFFLQALNPRPASRAHNLPTAWLSLGRLHRPLLEAKLASGRGQIKATGLLAMHGNDARHFEGGS